MKQLLVFVLFSFFVASIVAPDKLTFSTYSNKSNLYSNYNIDVVDLIKIDIPEISKLDKFQNLDTKISKTVFNLAFNAYENLRAHNKLSEKPIITLVDFTKPSTEKRLWVIDVEAEKILFKDYCAHGKNTGHNLAKKFSNINSSYQSSLGFYKTGEIYYGKHGKSLRLDGLEKGFNCQARNRAIVMHGADYVSEDFIKKQGRLGRSFGCPSVTTELTEPIIDAIADETLLFLYYPDSTYLKESPILSQLNMLSANNI